MKLTEVEDLIKNIKELKSVTDRQEYLVSSKANQIYNSILPVLDKELNRLQDSKIEVNCPQIMILRFPDRTTSYSELINKKLQELVLQDLKIIDYDFKEFDNEYIAIIKYTS